MVMASMSNDAVSKLVESIPAKDYTGSPFDADKREALARENMRLGWRIHTGDYGPNEEEPDEPYDSRAMLEHRVAVNRGKIRAYDLNKERWHQEIASFESDEDRLVCIGREQDEQYMKSIRKNQRRRRR
jgi:hypothetical protein